MAALIPLFPLDVVLFPGTPLPLHIFEPRYKEMIAECLAQNRTFGVVRALEEGLAEVGCTAEIVTIVKEYADGQLDLVAEGRNRFEIVGVNQERSFLQAEVLMVVDEPGAPAQEETARAVQLHSELLPSLARNRISPPPTLRCFLSIWPGRSRSIWISSRNYLRCAPRSNGLLYSLLI